jgi:hypothetical protein
VISGFRAVFSNSTASPENVLSGIVPSVAWSFLEGLTYRVEFSKIESLTPSEQAAASPE